MDFRVGFVGVEGCEELGSFFVGVTGLGVWGVCSGVLEFSVGING